MSETLHPDRVHLANVRLICPATGRDEAGGLMFEAGKIADVGPHLYDASARAPHVVNGLGAVACPGLIDCQVFTGEPGEEHRETLRSASRSAAAGGVTTMLCMPNTDPVIDDVALVYYIMRSARENAVVNVLAAAALTKNLEGREMTEIGLLHEAGAAAFTNGKRSVVNAQVMRLAMAYAKDFDAVVIHNVEDRDLADSGVMHEGEVSARLGMQGIPAAAETIVLERDLRLLALSGGRYHVAALSSRDSLQPIRDAKAAKLNVTCGVSINNLTLNEYDIGSYKTYCKVKPPLRSEDDRRGLVAAVADGTIDVIVSNHDPQDADTKRRPFAEASDGAIGLETMLSAGLQLYHRGELDLIPLLAAMTAKPAALLGLSAGRLAAGAPADVTLIDLEKTWTVDKRQLKSRSRNSPFDERALKGRVTKTFVGGALVYDLKDG
jgi:dihydroorotase